MTTNQSSKMANAVRNKAITNPTPRVDGGQGVGKSCIHADTRVRSAIDEAQILVQQCAEPRPAGDQVKAAILRASRRLGFSFNRTKDLWYRDASRIDAEEMDMLRHAAFRAELTHAVANIEILRSGMLALGSESARQVVAGLDAALRALGCTAGEGGRPGE
jgi:hypothetical protein